MQPDSGQWMHWIFKCSLPLIILKYTSASLEHIQSLKTWLADLSSSNMKSQEVVHCCILQGLAMYWILFFPISHIKNPISCSKIQIDVDWPDRCSPRLALWWEWPLYQYWRHGLVKWAPIRLIHSESHETSASCLWFPLWMRMHCGRYFAPAGVTSTTKGNTMRSIKHGLGPSFGTLSFGAAILTLVEIARNAMEQ